MRIAINGMGRIGRLLFRRLMTEPRIELVAVNDIMNPENLAYLLKYDSIYGKANLDIDFGDKLTANGKEIIIFAEPDPSKLPWEALEIDIVLECTGQFTTKNKAGHHISAGAKKVLLSTTGSNDIPLLIYGFNQSELTRETEIFSPGGCMTNCCTHLIQILSHAGIESLQINVLHSYTSRQELVDGPHKDFRRGRAASESIIPVAVDLAESLELLFPDLKNKLAAVTTRIPVANGAMADCNFVLKDELTKGEINLVIKNMCLQQYAGIIEYTEDPIVSLDVKQNTHSAIIDGTLTSVAGRQVKIIAFFDNEFGYTSRIIDWLHYCMKF